MDFWLLPILVFTPFLFVILLGPWVISFCKQQGLVAPILHYKSHRKPTPHGGGVLIVFVTLPLSLLVICGLPFLEVPVAQQTFLLALFGGAIPLAYLGWRDDVQHLSPFMRLLFQIIIVGSVTMFLPPLFDLVPLWLEKVIIVLAWSWFLNLYNFMDGLDGLATSEAVFLAAALAFFVPQLAPICALLAGACLGFLRINWFPAKVFLGDVGSTYLGFVLGGLLLVALEWDTWRLVYPLFTLTLVFSGDATYTLFRCLCMGHKPWIPHRYFWFHRAHKAGLSHQGITLRVLLMNIALLSVAAMGYAVDAGPMTLIAGIGIVASSAWRVKELEKKKEKKIL